MRLVNEMLDQKREELCLGLEDHVEGIIAKVGEDFLLQKYEAMRRSIEERSERGAAHSEESEKVMWHVAQPDRR